MAVPYLQQEICVTPGRQQQFFGDYDKEHVSHASYADVFVGDLEGDALRRWRAVLAPGQVWEAVIATDSEGRLVYHPGLFEFKIMDHRHPFGFV